MPAPARALMAGLACFVIWTMIRACRNGTLFSDGWAFSALTPHGEEARSAVSNHEATVGPASFETPRFARLLRMRV